MAGNHGVVSFKMGQIEVCTRVAEIYYELGLLQEVRHKANGEKSPFTVEGEWLPLLDWQVRCLIISPGLRKKNTEIRKSTCRTGIILWGFVCQS